MSGTDWRALPITNKDGTLVVGSHAVVDEAELPILEWMASQLPPGGDVLVIGYGLGIVSRVLDRLGCRSQTVIEAHPEIAAAGMKWAAAAVQPSVTIEGFWEDVLPTLGTFDGILYDSFESSPTDRVEYFAAAAAPHLRPGGVFVGWSDMDPPRESLTAALLAFCDDVRFAVLRDLPKCGVRWQSDRLVFPVGIKRGG